MARFRCVIFGEQKSQSIVPLLLRAVFAIFKLPNYGIPEDPKNPTEFAKSFEPFGAGRER